MTNMNNRRANGNSTTDNRTLVITLSTVLSVVGLVTILFIAFICVRRYRRRRGALFQRGITPIDDDEIEAWRLGQADEKAQAVMSPGSIKHTPNTSTSTTIKRTGSVIQYTNGARPSMDLASPISPMCQQKRSMSFDLPRVPDSALLARAPNSRSGLTDEAVPGDQPYVATLKRSPSRLYKQPPGSGSPPREHERRRSKGSRSDSLRTSTEQLNSAYESAAIGTIAMTPRRSADLPSASKKSHARIYSSSSVPPSIAMNAAEQALSGLSAPPPNRRTPADEIGRAIG